MSVSRVRLRFLGTGTSAGVPPIGGAAGAGHASPFGGADPRDRRMRTSATVEFVDASGEERVILIDAGPDLRRQAVAAGLRRVDAILLTHGHVDHTFGLDEVRRFNVLMDRAISVYADEHTTGFVQRVYRHIFRSEANVQRSFVATLTSHLLRPLEPVELFGLRVTPLPLLHGRLPILGFRFEAVAPAAGPAAGSGQGVLPLAYATDTNAIPPETWPLLDGLGVLVLDGLRYRSHPTHFTLDESAAVAGRVGADRTFLVHMSHEVVHARAEAELADGPGSGAGPVRLAYDGLVVS